MEGRIQQEGGDVERSSQISSQTKPNRSRPNNIGHGLLFVRTAVWNFLGMPEGIFEDLTQLHQLFSISCRKTTMVKAMGQGNEFGGELSGKREKQVGRIFHILSPLKPFGSLKL